MSIPRLTRSNISSLLRYLALYSAVTSGSAVANQPLLHGYLSQGITYTDDNGYIEDDAGWSGDLTAVAVNGSLQLHDRWRIAAQGMYLNGGNRYREGTRLDYMLLDYHLARYDRGEVHLILGRFKNAHGLYRDTREVPSAQPSIISPQSVYWDMYRDQTLNTDGVSFNGNHLADAGQLTWQLSAGRTDISDETVDWILGEDSNGKLDEDYVVQGSFYFTDDTNTWTLGLSSLYSELDFHPRGNSFAFAGSTKVWESILSAQYQLEKWEITFEYILDRFELDGIYAPGFEDRIYSDGYYLQGIYPLTPSLRWLLRYDARYLDTSDRDGSNFEKTTGAPDYFAFAKDITTGLSWQGGDNWMISAEYHYVDGAAWLPPHLTPNTERHDSQYWNLFAVQFAYWF